MKIVNLTPQERLVHHASHKVIVEYTDLVAAATSQTLQIFPKSPSKLIAGAEVRVAKTSRLANFAGNSTTSIAVTVGDAASASRYIASQELNDAGSEITFKANANTTPYAYSDADIAAGTDEINAAFTAVGGNFGNGTTSLLTSGKLEIYLMISNINDLKRG